jgi:predicted PilT family ATPase
MEGILTQVLSRLKHRGKDGKEKQGMLYEELSPMAKSTFDRWQVILNTKEITLESLKTFLQGERESLIKEIATPDHELNSKEDMFLKARLNDIIIILSLLESPQKAASMLESYLKKKYNLN